MTDLRPGAADPAMGSTARARNTPVPLLVAIVAAAVGISLFLLGRFGPLGFIVALVLMVTFSIYAFASFRNLSVPFYVWLVTIGGFRFLWGIRTPILPDVTLDRIAMVWLTGVVMVKFVAERRTLLRFGKLDALIMAHCLYILVRVVFDDMVFFRAWTMSILIPYAAYFFAKNIVTTMRNVRVLLACLLVLGIYYNITAVAEKLHWDWLLWPPYMRVPHPEFLGRSSGPFRQAPLFGTIIGMMLPLHLYFFAKARSFLVKGLLFLSLNVGLAGLYFTYTRGSWLAGFLALAATALFNRRRYLAPTLVTVVLAAGLAVSVLGIGQDRFMKRRMENVDTIETRVGIAVTALRVWRSEPLFGVGFFRYRTVMEDYTAPVTLPVYGTVRLDHIRDISIHDIYLGPLAEDGLVGFTMQVGIYVLVFAGFWRRWRNSDPDDEFSRMVLPVFFGISVGYLVGGLAIDYRYFSFVGALYFVAAGIQDGHDPEQGKLTGDITANGAT